VGIGFGKYGFLCREYLELWGKKENYGKFEKIIDGIEVFEKYLTPTHRFIYNEILIGDAKDIVKKLSRRYDLVLLIDVLEHFSKEEGGEMIKDILDHNESVLISVPRDIGDQEDVFGNKHETHRAQWTTQDLKKMGPSFAIDDEESFIFLITKNKQLIKAVKDSFRKNRLKKILKRFPVLYRALKKISVH
jgi:hypothetical protein